MKGIPDFASAMFREPNLLVPGKKPTGGVKIDWSHPLANELTTYMIFQNGHPIDLAYNNAYMAEKNPGNMTRNAETITVNTINYEADLEGYVDEDVDYTSMHRVKPTNASVTTHNSKFYTQYGGRGVTWDHTNSDARHAVNWRDTTYSWQRLDLTNTTHGIWHQIAVTFDIPASGDGLVTLYEEGVQTASSTNLTTFAVSGVPKAIPWASTLAEYDYLFLWRRTLSAGEVLDMTNDPYQILIPA